MTSTYWPGRKCAAYRGVPERSTSRIMLHRNQTKPSMWHSCCCCEHTWLDESVVGDSKGGDFLLRGNSCTPEHLHLFFRPLSVTQTGRGGRTTEQQAAGQSYDIIKMNSRPVMTCVFSQAQTHTHSLAAHDICFHLARSRLRPLQSLKILSLPFC